MTSVESLSDRVSLLNTRVVAAGDEEIADVSAAGSNSPGELVITLSVGLLRGLQIGDVLVGHCWGINGIFLRLKENFGKCLKSKE